MPSLVRLIPVAALLLVRAAPVYPQDHHEHPGPRLEHLGQVRFATSCNPDAQKRFERGVALLHSFWYEEAEAAFTSVVSADSGCALGYWGQAMSRLHPLWTPPTPADLAAGRAAAASAVRLSRAGTRERAYAAAIAAFYRDEGQPAFKDRLAAYEAAMASLASRYPGDEEGRTFYALSLIALGQLNAGDTTYARQRKAADILEPLYAKHPDHPGLAHYLIHTYDSPRLAARGAKAAARYAAIAPSVPHAQHMPSHIYTRLGEWDPSIASNLNSAEAAARFEESRHLNALWDQRAHAWDYLVYAYLQLGRDAEADRIADQARGVTAVFPENSLINDYALAAIPARCAVERGRWDQARALPIRPAPAWRGTEAITHFARSMGAARTGDTLLARAEIAAMKAIEDTLVAAGGPQAYWAIQVRIQRLAAEGWLAHAAGDEETAVRQAAAAADLDDVAEKHPVTPGAVLPARELLGDLLLELNRPAQALQAYQTALSRQPNRARSLFGAARAAERAGDKAAAQTHYRAFIQLMSRADGDRPEVAAARKALTIN